MRKSSRPRFSRLIPVFLELGAHAVGRTHQDGLAKPGELVGCAEAPDVGEHAARERLARELLDGRDGAVAFIDIHARVAVTNLFLGRQISV